MNLTQTLTSQACGPHGALGWLTALVMPLFTDVNCGDLARLLDLRAEDDLLEVACGSGRFLKKRASHVRRIAGIDQSDVQIRIARRRHRERIAAARPRSFRATPRRFPGEARRSMRSRATASAASRTLSPHCGRCAECFARRTGGLQHRLLSGRGFGPQDGTEVAASLLDRVRVREAAA